MAHSALFDSSQLTTLAPLMAGGGDCWLDQGCARPRPLPWPDNALLAMAISTAGALDLDLAQAFAAALVARVPELAPSVDDIAAALQEAVGNAVTHGNMRLDGALRASLEGLHAYAKSLETAKADPVVMGQPVCVWAARRRDRGTVALSVEDQGEGFAPPSLQNLRRTRPSAGGGLGLAIIARSVSSLDFERNGRRITMDFAAPG